MGGLHKKAMNKTILSFILISGFAFMGCTPHAGKEGTQASYAGLAGGFSQGDTLTQTDRNAFAQATAGHDFFADWMPQRVSRQVVAGTNYRFFCKVGKDEGTVEVFQPLNGLGRTLVTGINGQHNAALVIVNKKTGKELGRYEGETPKEYVGSLQDDFKVQKSKARLELRSAAAGEGYVWLRDFGTIAVKRSPAGYGDPLTTLSHTEGELPEVMPCTGLVEGHYRVVVDGTYGYVEADRMTWDALNTF